MFFNERERVIRTDTADNYNPKNKFVDKHYLFQENKNYQDK